MVLPKRLQSVNRGAANGIGRVPIADPPLPFPASRGSFSGLSRRLTLSLRAGSLTS